MAKADGDSPSSDDLKPHADEPMADEPVADYADLLSDNLLNELDATGSEGAAAAPFDEMPADLPLPEEGVLAALGDSVLGALDAEEGAEAAAEEPREEAKEQEVKPPEGKKPFQLPWYIELAAVVVVAAIVLGLAAWHLLGLSTALYLIAVALIAYGSWKGRATNSVYTVMLACALAAIVTAAYLLWLELERYNLDIKAREARQKVGMSQRLQFGPVSTTAAAWPAAVRLTSSDAGFEDGAGSPQIT